MINRHLVLHFNPQETNVRFFAIFCGMLKTANFRDTFFECKTKIHLKKVYASILTAACELYLLGR